jgi:uncharacterized protein with GYD domain
MPTYITLIRYTQQGVEKIKDSPKRLEAVRKAFRDAGAEMKSFYLVLGRYDAVAIAEAPDDETLAKLILRIGAQGNTRTETLRASGEEEYRRIVAAGG